MLKLSYSQIQKYQMCPKSYQFYYKDKLRPDVKSGALVFGSCLDSALNVLLLERDLPKAKECFLQNFRTFELNDKEEDLLNTVKVVYSTSDFDQDLLKAEDLEKLSKEIPFSLLKDLRSEVGYDGMTEEQKLSYNRYNFYAMRNKGLLMLESYFNNILPNFKKVLAVQKQIKMKNTADDEIVGYVDAIVEMENLGVVLIDNKTSSISYSEDSVKLSQQLALYSYILNDEYKIEHAAYVVLLKHPKKEVTKVCKKCNFMVTSGTHKTCNNIINEKRCGGEWDKTVVLSINTQFIVDKISPQKQEMVIENVDTITACIQNELFPRNFHVCENYFGGKCDYFNICHKK